MELYFEFKKKTLKENFLNFEFKKAMPCKISLKSFSWKDAVLASLS